MAKEYKPGFMYIKSDLLKQEVAFSKKTGYLYCEDGVEYSPLELEILDKAGCQITMAEHNVKKHIGGNIVEVKKNETKEVPSPPKQGELEIY